MNIFWILVIVAAVLIIFSGIFGFRGAGSIGWTILPAAPRCEISNHFLNALFDLKDLFSSK